MLRAFASRLLAATVVCTAALVGCGSDNDDLVASVPGAPTPPDGSDGVCCRVSEEKAGCVYEGGFSADGNCPDRAMLCDNLGPYSLGMDDHGCKVWGIFAK